VNPFEPVLVELNAAEQALAKIYAVAQKLEASGGLKTPVRTQVHALRDQLFVVQQALYQMMRTSLEAVAMQGLAERLPAPQPFPDLPGASSDGLGEVRAAAPILWAGLVLAVVGVFFTGTAIAIALGRTFLNELAEIQRHATAVRENTQRYRIQLDATQQRYFACLKAGGSPEACNEQAPVPEAPQAQERPTPSSPWLLAFAILGGLTLIGGGIYLVARSAPRYERTSTPRHYGARRRSPRAALVGGYNMEVEG
jgi:hypothetical protein